MARTRICLDGTWDFFVDPEERLTPEGLDQLGERRTIQVPAPWQAQYDDLRAYVGVAWYRRTVTANSAGDQQRWFLHFGAVDYLATVYLDGELLAEHEGGYLPFAIDLGDSLRPGEPGELVVRVVDPGAGYDAPGYPFAEIPHGKQSWYGPIGGIWQSVWLEARHPTHLVRLQITPDVPGEQAHVVVALSGAAERPLAVQLTVTDPRGREATHQIRLAAGTTGGESLIPIPDPLLWDTREPNLYRLEASLFADEGPGTKAEGPQAGAERSAADTSGALVVGPPSLVLDAIASTFGMRTIATSPGGHLMLNGRILYLRGALDQDYYPHTIYTPFSDEELEDQFAKARHMGLNCLRTHIKITDPRYYDAADRAGLLIWTELPNWENLTDEAKGRATNTLRGMVERDWNHPSIIIWTIINEGWGVDLMSNPDHREWLSATYAYLKALDPHRLIVGNSPCWGNFHVITDIEDFHNYYSIPDHFRKWREWVQAFAARPSWTFAYNDAESMESWQSYMRDPWNPTPRAPAPEVTRRGNEPMVVSEFGNWGLPDPGQLRACYGGEPWWFETGIEWGDGAVYPHGIEQRFHAYHLDKVFGDLTQLAAASQRMQFTALKYEIEQMRRHPSIVGYIITEFTDVHWEANGLLDICRNPKSYYDVIGNINSSDAIVPDWERVAFYEGERCEVRLTLSHFSPEDLRGGRLTWRMDSWPAISGSFEDIAAPMASVTNVGTVVFTVPPLEWSLRARLELQLLDAGGALITSNHHELYAFPRAAAQAGVATARVWSPDLADDLAALGYELADGPESADVLVVATLTDEWRRHVQRGGRVLWLAESNDAQQTNLGPLSVAQRRGRSWAGDWASNFNWIRQDFMFQHIPTGGTVDFAFADLTPDYVIVGLSPRDFAANVHAGLTVGWLHHTVALVAERRYGPGRLLISTFRLRDHLRTHPVAQIMLGDMVAHLTEGRR